MGDLAGEDFAPADRGLLRASSGKGRRQRLQDKPFAAARLLAAPGAALARLAGRQPRMPGIVLRGPLAHGPAR